jgi:hypothetical protein
MRQARATTGGTAMPVSFREIFDAFELASMVNGFDKHHAFLCRQTGKIYWQSEFSDEGNDELPDDINDQNKYIALPDRQELSLGKPLVLAFAREFLSENFDAVRNMFGNRGAYSKFKDLLARKRMLDRWYDFESNASEQALRDWCKFNSIAVLWHMPI